MSLDTAIQLCDVVADALLAESSKPTRDTIQSELETNARTMLSGFFASLVSSSELPSESFGSLVVDGFNEAQIWEQVKCMNDALYPLIKKRVKTVSKTAEEYIEQTEAATDQSKALDRGSDDVEEDEDGEDEDDAMVDDMEDDEDDLEGEEEDIEDDEDDMDADEDDMDADMEDDEEEVHEQRQQKAKRALEQDLPENYEEGDLDDMVDDEPEDDADLAAAEYDLEFSQDEASDGAQDEEDEPQESFRKHTQQKPDNRQLGKAEQETVSALKAKLAAMEEEIAAVEEGQLNKRHWTLVGEASAKTRPFNSVLDADLELPFGHMAADRRLVDEAPEEVTQQRTGSLESLIKQRIIDQTYDDVVKVAARVQLDVAPIVPNQFENLEFEKSKVGLGELYAQQYSAEILGNEKDEDMRISRDKQEARELFAKVMHKLDCLTNSSFKPRPPLVTRRPDGSLSEVPALKMEEAVPITLVAGASGGAPQEKLKRQTIHSKQELLRDDKQALRRAEKTRRRAKINQELKEGKVDLKGLEKRKLGKKGNEDEKRKRTRV